MNILQITPVFPCPPESGTRVELFNSIRYLSNKHSITLLSFAEKIKENDIAVLKPYCTDIVVIPNNIQDSFKGLLKNLFTSTPYNISKYISKAMIEAVQRQIHSNSFDLVRIDGLHMAYYINYINNLPAILREHNVESLIMKRFYKSQQNPFVKAYAYLQWKKLHRYEIEMTQRFDKCIMITEVDRDTLHSMTSEAKTEIVTAGVDTEYFKPDAKIERQPHQIVFTGEMAWRPNIDAVTWFCEAIFPLILEEIPDSKFYIVGRNATPAVKKLENENVIVTGRVEDVRPYVQSSAVFVVPIRVGGGMRLKILEAMAMGIPVVSTSIGCEGIAVENKKNILIADNAKAFAENIIRIMKKELDVVNLVEKGFELIKSRYSWQKIAEQYECIYQEVSGKFE